MSNRLPPERFAEIRQAYAPTDDAAGDVPDLLARIDQQAETIRRLRAERRVTKGLHAKIDAQAATIQRVRDAVTGWEYQSPNLHDAVIEALDGGQECPSCAQCDGSGKIPYTDLDKRGRSVDIIVECPRHALARLAINGDTK